MNMWNLILAVLPPFLLAYYIYSRDLYEKEPRKLVLKCLFYGALAFIPIFYIELFIIEVFSDGKFELLNSVFLFSLVGVALVEEGVKFFILIKSPYKNKDFNEPYDGIVYAVMISLGFALVENVLYVTGGGLEIALMRMFSAIPLHAACGVIMGYYVGKAKFDKLNKSYNIILGLTLATLLHAIYNYFLFINQFIIITFIALYIGIRFSRKAIKEHQENSPFKHEN
tara:strand:+ start:2438 stop:3115 length:678 start_codon:yes stop_codon:yes gene_type:complete